MPKVINDFYTTHHNLSLLILAVAVCFVLAHLKGSPGKGGKGGSRRRSTAARSSSSSRKRRR